MGYPGLVLVANRYRLGPSIARGGMGEVFRATDEQLGREVAVKLLLPSADEHANERFHREAQAAARLSDPHVVSVYDFGPHGDGFFLVMELVEGGTVATELARYGALPKDRAIRIVEQAAAGLAAAHREDVVHRDVKPGNLLLAADGTVKVADFGIAHLPADGANTLTATGQIIGSALYLAPERASGGPAGMPSDVYSLGCVLYQLVTGQPPFTGEHPAAILYQHVDAPAVLPSLERPELAGPFESVLMRMLAKDPADRPSAAEIAAGSLRAESPGDGRGVVPVVPPGIAPGIAPAGAAAGGAAGAATDAAAVPVGEEGTSALEPVDAAPVSRAEASRAEADRARNKALAAGVVAMIATAAAVLAVVLLNGREPTLPPTTEIDPPPGATSSTPNRGATTTAPSTDPTQAGTTSRTEPATSTPPSQSTSSQPTTVSTSPSPTSPSSTAPSSAPTTSSSRPTSPSTTTAPSSAPTSAPSSTARPSSTPTSQTPATTPATGTPATGAPATAPLSGAPSSATPAAD